MKKAIIILVLCGLLSCEEYEIQLPGNYYILKDGKNTLIVRSDRTENGIRNEIYPWVKEVVYDSSFIIAEQQPEFELYRGFLSDFLKNQYDIVAENDAHKEGLKRAPDLMLWPGYADSTNYKLIQQIEMTTKGEPAKEIGLRDQFVTNLMSNDPFQKKILSSKINYWVISLAKDTLFGPLDQSEYLKLRQQLSIPDNVKLAFER